MATSHPDSAGARSIGAGRKSEGKGKGGWLKWLLLALVLLLVIGALIALLSGGEDEQASPAAVAPAGQSQSAAGATGAAAAGGAGSQGSLVGAGGQSLLGASAATLGSIVGEQVTGRDLEVLSLVEDDGFFVGTSEQDRVYVEFGGDVGEDETAADFRPAVGDRVNLEGELRPAPADAGRTLRLERTDAQVVERQGAFVNATNVARGS